MLNHSFQLCPSNFYTLVQTPDAIFFTTHTTWIVCKVCSCSMFISLGLLTVFKILTHKARTITSPYPCLTTPLMQTLSEFLDETYPAELETLVTVR